MSRPKRKRKIEQPPLMLGFKPFGIPLKHVNCINLLFEEYEAIRLADYEMLTQEQAAERMQVSRPTFTRIYELARQKMARAFVEGQAIIIEGGDIEVEENWFRCFDCNKLFKSKEPVYCINCNSKNIKDVTSIDSIDISGLRVICLECDRRNEGIPDGVCEKCCKRQRNI